MMRKGLLLATTMALLLPATAVASKVEYVSLVPISNGMTITIKGKAGETNNVTIGIAQDFPNDWRITDSAGIKDPLPPGCVRESPTSIRCPRSGGIDDPSLGPLDVVSFTVILADGNDSFRPADGGVPEDVELFVEAGEGNDTIIGHPGGGAETIQGGPGDDLIITGEPADRKELDGGTGDDKIFVGSGDGGGGGQVMAAKRGKGPKGAEIRGAAGNDKLVGGRQGDRISGGSGNDKLKGKGGRDRLLCGGGKDKAVGGPGADSATGCEKAKGI
jgi:Ca2+-binding RTX toxin-like protein